jgi:heat-inducible transcriptional repressor
MALVAAAYGLPARKLGTVSLMGPVRMDYAEAIVFVREAAHQLSRYIETVYDDA